MRLIWALLLMLAGAAQASERAGEGPGEGRGARIEAAVRAWADAQGASAWALAVTRDGAVVHEAAQGVASGAVLDLQSNTKAITAICVKKAVDAGAMAWDAPISAYLGDGIALADPGYGAITVAQLVTHRSGLWPDQTQGAMPRWYAQGKGPRHWQATKQALSRETQRALRGEFHYNNENYAILGVLIERATGQGYMKYCAPEGAVTEGRVAAFLTWGGLSMSMADHARWFAAQFGQGPVFESPLQYPNAEVGQGYYYGLGVFERKVGPRWNFWHSGALCMGPLKTSGSFAVIWGGRIGVSVWFDICPGDADIGALDRALIGAVFR